MLNTAIIMGRICNDLELRRTQSGVEVTKFTVAVDRAYTKGDERKTDFINVTAWRGTASFLCKYFNKGSMIAVQGAIQTGSYEKDGNKYNTFEIVADNVSFCGGKNDGQSSNGTDAPSFTPSADDFTALADDDDSLPF